MPKIHKKYPNRIIEMYFNEIGAFSPIDSDMEIKLATMIRDGDEDALKKLVTANLRFVVSVAKEYQGKGLPLQDLISAGNLGLIKAATKYDETRGFKFISYAVWWIRQAILLELAEHSRVVRLPYNKVGLVNNVARTFEKLDKELGRPASRAEVANAMNITEQELEVAMILGLRTKEMDAPLGHGKPDRNEGMHRTQASTQFAKPDQSLIASSLKSDVETILSTLKPDEAKIIKLLFGIGTNRPLTLKEVGNKLGLSKERVRQVRESALRCIRRRSSKELLRKYLG